jgi:hypothetical protein
MEVFTHSGDDDGRQSIGGLKPIVHDRVAGRAGNYWETEKP